MFTFSQSQDTPRHRTSNKISCNNTPQSVVCAPLLGSYNPPGTLVSAWDFISERDPPASSEGNLNFTL